MAECEKEVATEREVTRRACEGRDTIGGYVFEALLGRMIRDGLVIVAGAGDSCEIGVLAVAGRSVLLV